MHNLIIVSKLITFTLNFLNIINTELNIKIIINKDKEEDKEARFKFTMKRMI